MITIGSFNLKKRLKTNQKKTERNQRCSFFKKKRLKTYASLFLITELFDVLILNVFWCCIYQAFELPKLVFLLGCYVSILFCEE